VIPGMNTSHFHGLNQSGAKSNQYPQPLPPARCLGNTWLPSKLSLPMVTFSCCKSVLTLPHLAPRLGLS